MCECERECVLRLVPRSTILHFSNVPSLRRHQRRFEHSVFAFLFSSPFFSEIPPTDLISVLGAVMWRACVCVCIYTRECVVLLDKVAQQLGPASEEELRCSVGGRAGQSGGSAQARTPKSR